MENFRTKSGEAWNRPGLAAGVIWLLTMWRKWMKYRIDDGLDFKLQASQIQFTHKREQKGKHKNEISDATRGHAFQSSFIFCFALFIYFRFVRIILRSCAFYIRAGIYLSDIFSMFFFSIIIFLARQRLP